MKTSQDVNINFRDYGRIVVPKGTKLTHKTACGIDKHYHFVEDLSWIMTDYPKISNILFHDATYYGIDIPKKFVEYDEEPKPTEERNLDKIIRLSEHKMELTKELKVAVLTEQADYVVDQVSKVPETYVLIKQKTGEITIDGTKATIEKYIRRRKIDKVYWRQ